MDVGTGILNSNKLNYILVVINNIIYSLIKNFPMKKEFLPTKQSAIGNAKACEAYKSKPHFLFRLSRNH